MENNNMEMSESTSKQRKFNLGAFVGQAVGLILCMCASAIIIASTIKLIMWIL